MNLTRRFGISSAIAAGGLAAVALIGAPASAIAATATTSAAAPAAASPATVHWLYWGLYGTEALCNAEGNHLVIEHSVLTYKCVAINEGDYTVDDLYVQPGMPPGS
jgi:hypothetical protein